jgi:hypothetical protein
MSTLSASLFTSSSATQAQWKSVAGKSSEAAATAVFQPKQAAGDSVSVSKLGQALKGVAADIFSVMDKKTKQTVEKIVDSGAMSAEDVATALRDVASSKLFDRHVAERPKDAQDKMMLEYSEKVQANMDRFTEEFGVAGGEYNKALTSAYAALERGEVDTPGFQKMMEEPNRVFKEKREAAEKRMEEAGGNDMGKYVNVAFKKNLDGFESAVKEMGLDGEDGFMDTSWELYDSKAEEKTMKLMQMVDAMSGLPPHSNNGVFKAVSAFVDSVELPGIGRKGASLAELQAANGDSSGKAAAAPANPAAQALSQAQTAAATAAPATKTATAAADPGKGKSAVSLLQSAIDANAKAHQPAVAAVAASSDKADAGLSSLLDALKSGAKPASPNVKIDT